MYVTKYKGSTMCKVVGILMIIFGAIGIIVSMLGVIGLSVLDSAARRLPEISSALSLSRTSIIIALVGTIIELVLGILSVVNSKKPNKSGILIIGAIVLIATSLVSNVMSSIATDKFGELIKMEINTGTSVIQAIFSLILPVLLIIGALSLKKAIVIESAQGFDPNMQQPYNNGNMQQPYNNGNMQQPYGNSNMQQPYGNSNMQQPYDNPNIQSYNNSNTQNSFDSSNNQNNN